MTYNIICADVLEWAAGYTGEPFMAILCDPPYSMKFMGKDWDDAVAMHPETWAALAEHLLPGGFLMAFGGARTYHRLACAIEDAGLVIHPAMGWLNGQGFPKSTRIDTQIDKRSGKNVGWFGPWLRKYREQNGIKQKELARHFPSKTGGLTGCVANWELGFNLPTNEQFNKLVKVLNLPFESLEQAEREVIGQRKSNANDQHRWLSEKYNGHKTEKFDVTAPATPLAAQWEGHRYGLQAIKPALEFIALAQKPYEGKPVESIVETGAGALNIDGGRIGTDDALVAGGKLRPNSGDTRTGAALGMYQDETPNTYQQHNNGRWPANFALVHVAPHACPDCDGDGWRIDGTAPMTLCPTCFSDEGGLWLYDAPTHCPACGTLTIEHKEADNRIPCDCDGGLVGGCRRVGTRKVKPTGGRGQVNRECSMLLGQMENTNTETGPVDADGTETVADWECEETCPVQRLNAMGPTSTTGNRSECSRNAVVEGTQWLMDNHRSTEYPNEKGGPSRFFHNASWLHEIAEQLSESDNVRYQAKAGRKERDAGLDGVNVKHQANINKIQGSEIYRNRCVVCNASLPNKVVEHCGKKPARVKENNVKVRNPHPTVKPIALTQWLATLLLPPDAYAPRRILVPFAGSGSEAIGAMLAGWDEIVGMEMMPEYVDIANARLAWWTEQAAGQMWPDVKEILKMELTA